MEPKILIGVPVKNCARFVGPFIDQILQLDYPVGRLTVGFLENDSTDDSLRQLEGHVRRLTDAGFDAQVASRRFGINIPHTSRHRAEVRTRRRWCIRQARQAIMDTWFGDHDYLMWFDVDFVVIPPNTLTVLSAADKPIVIPVYVTTDGVPYDRHTGQWTGPEQGREGRYVPVDELLQMHPELLIPVQRVDGACLMRREVLAQYRFTDGLNLEAPDFSKYIAKDTEGLEHMGLEMFVHRGVTIQHALINGMQLPEQISAAAATGDGLKQ